MNNRVEIYKLGSDPEFFLMAGDKPISAEGLIGGSKDFPLPISDRGHGLQEDNVMLEITIPPCETPAEMYAEIQYAIKEAEKMTGYTVVNAPSMRNFRPEELDTQHAKTVGCDPDFNAWTREQNPIPELPEDIRFAGGHVHISLNGSYTAKYLELLIKHLDYYLALNAVIEDTDDERKKIYGTAGRFRFKPYGIEYRSLSNYWTCDLNMIKNIFERVRMAVNDTNNCFYDNAPVKQCIIDGSLIDIINNNDKENAERLLQGVYEAVK